jgi:mono/diheme cytochrome c family protein
LSEEAIMRCLRWFATLPHLLLVVALVWVAVAAQTPQESAAPANLIRSLKGRDLYRAYCASCHGREGRGDGPAASAMKENPPDLTKIARRNENVFPREKVRGFIVGTAKMPASHGSREMPVWGPIFHQVEEQDRDYGMVRVENLVRYLESIQK